MIRHLALFAMLSTAVPAVADNPFSPGMYAVKIEAADFEKSARFYGNLGMKVGAKRDTTWELVWDGATKNSGILMTTPDYAHRADLVRGGSYLMIMTEDTQAVADRLRKDGFDNVPDPRALGTLVSVLLVRDPDGNRVEIMGPLKGH